MAKQEQAKDLKTTDSSQTEDFRELIIGTDQSAVEDQLKGMRDLFTSVMLETRKDYDNQINEFKSMFISALEDNKRDLQNQIQELKHSIPQIVGTSETKNGEDYIMLTELEDVPVKEHMEKYSRLEAVKEIILGTNLKDFNAQIKTLTKQLVQNTETSKQEIMQMAEEVSNELAKMDERINKAIETLIDTVGNALKSHKNTQANKNQVATWVQEISERI